MLELTNDELLSVYEALTQLVLDGASEGDHDPISTALVKVEIEMSDRELGEQDT